MTKEQAIKLAESGWWKESCPEAIVSFQLFEEKLCMDFSAFHKAVETCLGRPVFIHEFGSLGIEGLRKEFLGDKSAPSLSEIMELIPANTRVFFITESDRD